MAEITAFFRGGVARPQQSFNTPNDQFRFRQAGALRLFASPWSPPAWMKTNNDMLHGGKLKPEYRQAWADYFVKYIRAYAGEGLPIWGITVQNEAMATQVWESCIFTAAEEKDFVRDYLGPTLHKNGLGDVKITIWDHNRGIMYQRAKTVLEDPRAARYVWGTGFHWYVGDHFDNDIVGAMKVGMRAAWIRAGDDYPAHYPDPWLRIVHLSELLPHVLTASRPAATLSSLAR